MVENRLEPIIAPMLALRGIAIFPGMILHFDVGRNKSIKALNKAMSEDQMIFLAAQRDVRHDDPAIHQIYDIGCVAHIRQILKLPGDNMRVLVEGRYRASIATVLKDTPYFMVELLKRTEKPFRVSDAKKASLIRHTKEKFQEYANLSGAVSPDIILELVEAKEPGYICDYIASNLAFPLESKQAILSELHPIKRMEKLLAIMEQECEILKVDQEIQERVQQQIDENQREYYLREQIKAISAELTDDDNPRDEAEVYNEKIQALDIVEDSKDKLLHEANKLYKMPPGSHEATVVRSYLDTCLSLPWGTFTTDKVDLHKSEHILNKDHYGLDKVKQRILELLAVRKLAPNISGQIICLVGPPGVGKTSIARSIAECMGRKYARVSLGGVRDEADIRGHRKTYIGAMPGRIINGLKEAGSANPLLLLDEVDKLGSDYRGDPSAALLEVLDSEQNNTFRDHYIELPFDLSQVLFVTTANNQATIPRPLLDRMEVIHLSSYTGEEKFQIAKRHLLPKQLKRHGLSKSTCKIHDDAIYGLIDYYTRESGVRNLEREIASLCRKAAKKLVMKQNKSVTISAKNLEALLGVHRFKPEQVAVYDEVGVVNGLAWTSVGGEIMQIEAAALEGKGRIVLTGSLGDVMKESAQAGISYIRSRAQELKLDKDFYNKLDIHIHATEGAVPKDGPSAGIAMVTALVSALTGVAVKRDVAMTGEITIRGRVLPIGGLKEKTMAAYRAGIKTIIIPTENVPDLSEIDKVVTEQIKLIPAASMDTVLKSALVDPFFGNSLIAKDMPVDTSDKSAAPAAIAQ